tara:strand:- start:339 stop:578 length:240 start_codon:yes stop_codon:yes gene_type:complete
MNLLSWVLAIAVSSVLYWQQIPLIYVVIGGIGTLVFISLFTRSSSSTKIEEGVQIVISSEKTGTHLGSEESPFGRVRSE